MDASDVKKPNDVATLRELIDAIDDELIELLRKRIELSGKVMETKPKAQLIDADREQAILDRYSAKLADTSTEPKTKRLVLGILGTSRLYPEEL